MNLKTIVVGVTVAAVQVSVGLKAYGNSYQVIPGPFDWNEAKIDAEVRGGHLATITSAAEWQAIVNQIGLPIPIEPLAGKPSKHDCWGVVRGHGSGDRRRLEVDHRRTVVVCQLGSRLARAKRWWNFTVRKIT